MFKLILLFTDYMNKYIFEDNVNRNLTIGKLVCLARTYKMHAKEIKSDVPKEPLLFFFSHQLYLLKYKNSDNSKKHLFCQRFKFKTKKFVIVE